MIIANIDQENLNSVSDYFHSLFFFTLRTRTENLKHFNRAMLDSDININFDDANLFFNLLGLSVGTIIHCVFYVWSES